MSSSTSTPNVNCFYVYLLMNLAWGAVAVTAYHLNIDFFAQGAGAGILLTLASGLRNLVGGVWSSPTWPPLASEVG